MGHWNRVSRVKSRTKAMLDGWTAEAAAMPESYWVGGESLAAADIIARLKQHRRAHDHVGMCRTMLTFAIAQRDEQLDAEQKLQENLTALLLQALWPARRSGNRSAALEGHPPRPGHQGLEAARGDHHRAAADGGGGRRCRSALGRRGDAPGGRVLCRPRERDAAPPRLIRFGCPHPPPSGPARWVSLEVHHEVFPPSPFARNAEAGAHR